MARVFVGVFTLVVAAATVAATAAVHSTVLVNTTTIVACAANTTVFQPAAASASPLRSVNSTHCALSASAVGVYVVQSTPSSVTPYRAVDRATSAQQVYVADAFSGYGGVVATEVAPAAWGLDASAVAGTTEGNGSLGLVVDKRAATPGGVGSTAPFDVFATAVNVRVGSLSAGAVLRVNVFTNASLVAAGNTGADAAGVVAVNVTAAPWQVAVVSQRGGVLPWVLAIIPLAGSPRCAAPPAVHDVVVTVNESAVVVSVCGLPPVSARHKLYSHDFVPAARRYPFAVSNVAVVAAPTGTAVPVGGPLVVRAASPGSAPRSSFPDSHLIRPRTPPQLSLGAVHAAAEDAGVVDVSLQPFNADPSGVTDSTAALQQAIVHGYMAGVVVFIPRGRYRITDTLLCSKHDGRYPSSYVHGEDGATLFVPDGTPGFTNASAPKYVLHLEYSVATGGGGTVPQPNINFNQVVRHLRLELGRNPGAVGIRHRAAQGSSIQDVVVDATDGALAGIEGGAGSGGSHVAVTVLGGRWGANYAQAQPAPTAASFTLINQTCAGVVYCGGQSLTLLAASISADARQAHATYAPVIAGVCNTPSPRASGPCAVPPAFNPQAIDAAVSGQVSVVDSVFALANGGANSTAVWTASNMLNMRNTYVRGFSNVAWFNATQTAVAAAAAGSQWTDVRRLVAGAPSPPHTVHKHSYVLQAPSFVNGTRQPGLGVAVADVVGAVNGPPATLLSQHSWGPAAAFPSWATPGAVNVRSAFGAAGDGVTDDTAALSAALASNASVVWLPRGVYRVSATLEVRPGQALVGTAHHLTAIAPSDAWAAAPSTPPGTPLVRTLAGAPSVPAAAPALDTVVTELLLYTFARDTANVTAMEWRAEGARSVLRQCGMWISSWLCTAASAPSQSWCPPTPAAAVHNAPQLAVRGGGRGLFYVAHFEDSAWMGPEYRHVLVAATGAGPREFVHLNTEHAESDANLEVAAAHNVAVYGLKSEGRYCVVWLRDVVNVTVGGYGGNACPFHAAYPAGFAAFPPSLFRVTGTVSNVELVNLVSYDTGGTLAVAAGVRGAVPCAPPDQWVSVWVNTSQVAFQSQLLDRPVWVVFP